MKDTKNKLIMKFYRYLLASLFLACMFPSATEAASVPALSISADTTDVTEGQPVNVRVDLSNNPGLSTLGLSLDYDSSILQYSGSTWNDGFSGSDMVMASDDGGTVNISAVCDDVYTENGTVITIHFDAVGISQTVPVTLRLRDMSDGELNGISGSSVSSRIKAPESASQEKEDVPDDGGTEAADSRINGTESPAADVDSQKQQEGAVVPAVQTVSENTESASQVLSSQKNAAAGPDSRPDENYKTGAGIGNDIFLLLAAVLGVAALAAVCRKERKHGKQE